MIRDLGENGVTVLLSSHILAEVQQVCHSVSIIGNGRLLASGAVEDLVGEQSVKQVRVGVADPGAAQRVLETARFRVTRDGDRLLVEGADRAEHITRVLAEPADLRPRADPGPRRPRVGLPPAHRSPARHRPTAVTTADRRTDGAAA